MPVGAGESGVSAPAETRGAPPALGGRIWGILLRNEWFKTRKRPAFWVALGFFAFITFMNHAQGFFESEPDFRLPDVWGQVFGDDSILLLFFGGMALMMLAPTEFTWRTARQNVIDGLSKAQWFWGKSTLLPILGLGFVGAYVLIPGLLALVRTDLAGARGSLVPPSVWGATGGLLLAFLCVGSLGFFVALAVRGTGGSMGTWFLWILAGEQLIIPALVGRLLPGLESWLAFMPFTAAQGLLPFEAYDAAAFQRLVAAAREAGQSAPDPPALARSLAACAAWTVVFLGASLAWFRRRDL